MTDSDKFESLIRLYKKETDNKKKHILYLNLVEEALTLVNRIVASFCPLPPNLPKEDLMQVGAIGLLKSIDTYKIQETGSFKTYTSKFIRGKILQYLRDKVNIVKLPRETTQNINLVKEYITTHSNESEITPDTKEISKALNIPENKVIDILNIDSVKNIISLDQSIYSTDGIETLADRIQSEDNKNFQERYENKKIIEYALNKLPAKEKDVICGYFIQSDTKKNIAKRLNISATQVARLIKRALNKMYAIIESDLNQQEDK